MAIRTAVRVAPRAIAPPLCAPRPSYPLPRVSQAGRTSRSFFNLPSTEPQTVRARRTLPYPSAPLYDLIADIDAYSRFLPYCTTSRVTSWTPAHRSDSPDPQQQQRRWPTAGTLSAGWSGLAETYSSRVFCIPDRGIVEAISGSAWTKISPEDLQRWGLRDSGPAAHAGEEGTFRSLVTQWTVRPVGGREGSGEGGTWSEVDLSIMFQFVNPLYGAVSSAVADKVAPIMVSAFEKEARRVLGPPKLS
ncbi:hypothetical protein JX266_001487 [Neoarthrinium moseri]|nr:hypothetical protein JX266_001487 [Neoarthrinium moseri]